MESKEFLKFRQAVDQGDLSAALEALRPFEPELRRRISARLRNTRLRRLVDTSDVWQSIQAELLHRLVVKEAFGTSQERLVGYLHAMIRNKIASKYRKERRNLGTLSDSAVPKSPQGAIVDRMVEQDLIDVIRSRLKPEQQWTLDQIASGRTWIQIGEQVGERPDTLSKRLRRAIAAATVDKGGVRDGS